LGAIRKIGRCSTDQSDGRKVDVIVPDFGSGMNAKVFNTRKLDAIQAQLTM